MDTTHFERVTGTGDAIIHKGDPREPGVEDMDIWWNSLLGSVQPALHLGRTCTVQTQVSALAKTCSIAKIHGSLL